MAGCDLRTDGAGVRRAIGYVPEHGTVYEGLTADNLVRQAELATNSAHLVFEQRAQWLHELKLQVVG